MYLTVTPTTTQNTAHCTRLFRYSRL